MVVVLSPFPLLDEPEVRFRQGFSDRLERSWFNPFVAFEDLLRRIGQIYLIWDWSINDQESRHLTRIQLPVADSDKRDIRLVKFELGVENFQWIMDRQLSQPDFVEEDARNGIRSLVVFSALEDFKDALRATGLSTLVWEQLQLGQLTEELILRALAAEV